MIRSASVAGLILLVVMATVALAQGQASNQEGMARMHQTMHGKDGTGGMMGMCPMMGGGMGMGMMMVMMLLMAAFWVAAIAALVALTIFLLRKSRQLTPPTTST